MRRSEEKKKKHREQTDGVFSCWIGTKPLHQQHFLSSTHSAAYLTQTLTNLFFTALADNWISLFLLRKSDSMKGSSSSSPQKLSEVLSAKLYSYINWLFEWTPHSSHEQMRAPAVQYALLIALSATVWGWWAMKHTVVGLKRKWKQDTPIKTANT